MNPIDDLDEILRRLQPELRPEHFVFCSLVEQDLHHLTSLDVFASVREPEGLSVVVPLACAERAGLTRSETYRCLTMRVHSSLASVGLTAAVASALADRGIAANVIAGALHDHVLVPSAEVEPALTALEALSRSRRRAP